MKKIFIFTSSILLFFLVILSITLSTIGYKTNKFDKFISSKIEKKNKYISLKLNKIKFKLDIRKFDLFLETKNPKLTYKNQAIPLQDLKVYLDFLSLIKSKPIVDRINLSATEIEAEQLKKIIIKLKPSNLNSLIVNKVETGQLRINLDLYFSDNLNLKNFIAKGAVKNMNLKINNNLNFKKTEFNFFSDSSDILINNIYSKMNGLLIKNGNLQISKNNEIKIKSNFVTNVIIDKNNIVNFLPYLKNINQINTNTVLNANIESFLNVTFDNTLKVINYTYSNKGKINKLYFKFDKSIKSSFLNRDIDNLKIENSEISINYDSEKNSKINASGKYSIDNNNFKKYSIENNFLDGTSSTSLNFEFLQNFNLDFINYKKDLNKTAKIFLKIINKKNLINLQELKYEEDKNLILIRDLKIDKKNIVSLKKIQVKTFKNGNLKNDFNLNYGKKIKIIGSKYDANNLNKILKKKPKNNILSKINKAVEIDLKNIDTPLSEKLKNFRLIGVLKKGKFVKISSKGDFGNNKFLDITMKSDKVSNKKYLEVYSDLPQPLLSEYNFFKGLSKGTLTFSSIINGNTSTSKLVIDNFKIVNAPGVIKLLSLADFGGLADLAEGDGLSFEKMEVNMSNSEGHLKLTELIAVGPSISVLMEGYKEASGLTSLKGTLVPAKNLNKLLSKIPLIGKIIIPSEVGEGLFGVSFKMKGMPGKIKTTINPIKTITPRFITKVLEKSKKTK